MLIFLNEFHHPKAHPRLLQRPIIISLRLDSSSAKSYGLHLHQETYPLPINISSFSRFNFNEIKIQRR